MQFTQPQVRLDDLSGHQRVVLVQLDEGLQHADLVARVLHLFEHERRLEHLHRRLVPTREIGRVPLVQRRGLFVIALHLLELGAPIQRVVVPLRLRIALQQRQVGHDGLVEREEPAVVLRHEEQRILAEPGPLELGLGHDPLEHPGGRVVALALLEGDRGVEQRLVGELALRVLVDDPLELLRGGHELLFVQKRHRPLELLAEFERLELIGELFALVGRQQLGGLRDPLLDVGPVVLVLVTVDDHERRVAGFLADRPLVDDQLEALPGLGIVPVVVEHQRDPIGLLDREVLVVLVDQFELDVAIGVLHPRRHHLGQLLRFDAGDLGALLVGLLLLGRFGGVQRQRLVGELPGLVHPGHVLFDGLDGRKRRGLAIVARRLAITHHTVGGGRLQEPIRVVQRLGQQKADLVGLALVRIRLQVLPIGDDGLGVLGFGLLEKRRILFGLCPNFQVLRGHVVKLAALAQRRFHQPIGARRGFGIGQVGLVPGAPAAVPGHQLVLGPRDADHVLRQFVRLDQLLVQPRVVRVERIDIDDLRVDLGGLAELVRLEQLVQAPGVLEQHLPLERLALRQIAERPRRARTGVLLAVAVPVVLRQRPRQIGHRLVAQRRPERRLLPLGVVAGDQVDEPLDRAVVLVLLEPRPGQLVEHHLVELRFGVLGRRQVRLFGQLPLAVVEVVLTHAQPGFGGVPALRMLHRQLQPAVPRLPLQPRLILRVALHVEAHVQVPVLREAPDDLVVQLRGLGEIVARAVGLLGDLAPLVQIQIALVRRHLHVVIDLALLEVQLRQPHHRVRSVLFVVRIPRNEPLQRRDRLQAPLPLHHVDVLDPLAEGPLDEFPPGPHLAKDQRLHLGVVIPRHVPEPTSRLVDLAHDLRLFLRVELLDRGVAVGRHVRHRRPRQQRHDEADHDTARHHLRISVIVS